MTTTPTTNDDIDTIVGDPSVLHLEGADVDILIERLRTRQFFKLLKILTVGAGPMLAELQVSSDSSQEELANNLVALLIVSVPEAEDEVLDFIRSMVAPVDLISPEKTKGDRAANVEKYTELYQKLENPELEDTLDILIKVIKDESPNMLALGKRLAALLPSAAKQTTSSKKPSKKSTPSA